MKLIDMHCDTIFELFRGENMDLRQNTLCIDLEKMKKAECAAQFFACFIPLDMFQGENRWEQAYLRAEEMIAYAKREFEKCGEALALAKSYDDFLINDQMGKISAFLTIEEGGILDNKMENLRRLYLQGIRLITLTWNKENCIGFPNSRNANSMSKGLKPFGIEVIEQMNALGMIVDVSHLSDAGFWDVLRHSTSPVIASHSNARALCSHPRNLSDDMIRALSNKGGTAGLNFYPYFINESGKAQVDDMVRHIKYMYQVGGEDFVVMGTDFDGFSEGESQLKNIGELEQLFRALQVESFSERQLDKFWNGNALRVMKEIL